MQNRKVLLSSSDYFYLIEIEKAEEYDFDCMKKYQLEIQIFRMLETLSLVLNIPKELQEKKTEQAAERIFPQWK